MEVNFEIAICIQFIQINFLLSLMSNDNNNSKLKINFQNNINRFYACRRGI